jgi:hypothetical protein
MDQLPKKKKLRQDGEEFPNTATKTATGADVLES